MQFSADKNLSFDEAVELMFEKLGASKVMALASSVDDHVMVRNVSCLFYDGKVWDTSEDNYAFQVFIDFDTQSVEVKPYDQR